jgi:hypothetical protein
MVTPFVSSPSINPAALVEAGARTIRRRPMQTNLKLLMILPPFIYRLAYTIVGLIF